MKTEELKNIIEHVGEKIECDGDWAPTLIIEGETNALIGMEMVPGTKDTVAAAITDLMKQHKAQWAAWITTAWFVMPDEESAEEALQMAEEQRLCERSDKKECVSVVIAEKGKGITLLNGIIYRSDQHPKIHEWMEISDCESSGRFPDALMEGLK